MQVFLDIMLVILAVDFGSGLLHWLGDPVPMEGLVAHNTLEVGSTMRRDASDEALYRSLRMSDNGPKPAEAGSDASSCDARLVPRGRSGEDAGGTAR